MCFTTVKLLDIIKYIYSIFSFFYQTFSHVRMQSLAYVSTSWSTPCSSVWIGSELHIRQTEPIPRFGGFYNYNVSSVYHWIAFVKHVRLGNSFFSEQCYTEKYPNRDTI